MNNEKLSNEELNPPLRKTAVISCFISLKDSIEVVFTIFAFIGLLFLGVIIAPLLSAIKFVIKSYSKYYEWLFDWYVSKNSL
jgi:hypothetical protein